MFSNFYKVMFLSSFLFSSHTFAVESVDVDDESNVEESFCDVTDDGVRDLKKCLTLISEESKPFLPVQIGEDTKLVEIYSNGNKLVRKFDVEYDGKADFNDDESFDALRDVYIKAMPKTGNKTCERDTLTSVFYDSGMIAEYRYRVNGADKEVVITIDKQYCDDIGINDLGD